MADIFIIIGGVLNALLFLFHLTFWKAFNWAAELPKLSPENGAIMQVLNIHVTYTVGLFAVLSFFCHRELLETRIGRIVTGGIIGFYLLRAVDQLIFWGSGSSSIVAFVIALAFALCYDIPLHLTRAKTK